VGKFVADYNQARDVRQLRELKAMGLRTLVIWECALRGSSELTAFTLDRTEDWLRVGFASSEIARADWIAATDAL
jgi:DNA mismatch endonuclease (patch repair protein)